MTFRERTRALIQQELALPVPSQFQLGHFLGVVVVLLFLIEIVTGILLMVYYQPTVAQAHHSIQYILGTAQLGWLVRGLHSWGADLLILVILLHMLRVGLQGAYRERELNWGIGVVLFFLVLAFGFTGMLLLWDQQAFWTTDAARLALERIPLIGKPVLDFLWGGVELGEGALLRFYVFHVGLLPWFTTLLIAVHLYLVARQGLFVPASRKPEKPAKPVEGVSDDAGKNVR